MFGSNVHMTCSISHADSGLQVLRLHLHETCLCCTILLTNISLIAGASVDSVRHSEFRAH
jgi:hypothetical protein